MNHWKRKQSQSVALSKTTSIGSSHSRNRKWTKFILFWTVSSCGLFSVNIRTIEAFILLSYNEPYYPFVKELNLITSDRPAGYNGSQYPITFSIYKYYLFLEKFPALLPIELNGYYENRAGHFSDLDAWFYPGRQLVPISPLANACLRFVSKVKHIKGLKWRIGTEVSCANSPSTKSISNERQKSCLCAELRVQFRNF